MDSHSRSASPREQPRPQQRPPSPPSPRLPPAAFDNRAYQHDDADPNHNESFTSNGAQQNGHNKELNGESKTPEAVNLELINLTPKNGSLKQKKDVEVDMNGSNPYDEYFVPVNEHRKYMRGEKLYVTADKRGEKGGCKRPLCWTLLALVVAAIIALIALAATGVIFSNSPTPVDPYNVSISSARALGGIGQSLEGSDHNHDQTIHDHEHDHEHHDHSQHQNQGQTETSQDLEPIEHTPDQNTELPDREQDHDDHNQTDNEPNQDHNEQNEYHEQEEPDHVPDHNHDLEGQNQNENHHEPNFIPVHEHGEAQDHDHEQQDQVSENEQSDEAKQNDTDQSQVHNHNDQMEHEHNRMAHMPETTSDEGRGHSNVPDVVDMSIYVPRTVEGELKIDNEQFLEAYNDPESDEYRQFTESFKEALMRALFDKNSLELSNNDIKLELIQLRPGSVIVTYRIHWKPRNNDRISENILNATTLEEKLNKYLFDNNRMVSIYHIAEDHLAARPVLDLCQINKNDCQGGCEFDETSLDFLCTCPQGLMLDMNNLKTCNPYLPYPESKPEETSSSEATITTTTPKTSTNQIIEQSSGFLWKDIQAETTSEPEPDHKYPSVFDEHINNKWNSEPTVQHSMIPEAETTTKQTNEVKYSSVPVSEESVMPSMPVTEPVNLGAHQEIQNTTYLEIDSNTEQKLQNEHSSNVDEKPESNTFIFQQPKLDEEPKIENATQHYLSPNVVTEINTELKSNEDEISESEHQPNQYPEAIYNIDAALQSHQEIKPEEVYTEEPESTSSESDEHVSKEESHFNNETDMISKFNETSNLPEVSITITTPANSELEGSVELQPSKITAMNNFTTTANPTTGLSELNSINVPSHEMDHEIILPENDTPVGSSEKNINDSETSNDDSDDWLSDTLATDNKTATKNIYDVNSSSAGLTIANETEIGSDTESQSFKNSNEDNIFITPVSNNTYDVNNLLGLKSTDKNLTEDKEVDINDPNSNTKYSYAQAIDETETNKSISDKKDYNDIAEGAKNESYLYDEKKEVDYEMPSLLAESKVPTSDENATMIPESLENDTATANQMPRDFLKAMETLNESQINGSVVNASISENGKYVTFDDINMLLNRSSKSMDNLTQEEYDTNVQESPDNKTTEVVISPSIQDHSEWISETVTEVGYNERMRESEKTETTESVKNKIDHIMTHAKDDYEPDYLSKADDSMYIMERDYESEDPRVKRVNLETGTSTTELSKENNIELNSISNGPITNVPETMTSPSSSATINEISTTTTSVPSTTISEFIYSTSSKNMNDLYETLNQNASPVMLQDTSMLTSNDNESNSEALNANHTTTQEMNLISEPTSTTTMTSILDSAIPNVTQSINDYSQNETLSNNLDVTIYEIPHHVGNQTSSVIKSVTPQVSEYEDHEIEMNPFLPEAENNKNLVKKLQEGHDLELTNMNETQNDNSDEHHLNNTENHMMTNNESSIMLHSLGEHENTTALTSETYAPESQNVDNTGPQKPELSENLDNNKVLQDKKVEDNIESGQEVLPISTFLIDTDDLDTSTNFNKVSTSQTDKPLSRFTDSNNENLRVVPIEKEIEEKNALLGNSKIHSRYELNDISDTSKNSEKRTFDLGKFDTITNNES